MSTLSNYIDFLNESDELLDEEFIDIEEDGAAAMSGWGSAALEKNEARKEAFKQLGRGLQKGWKYVKRLVPK